MDVAKNGKIISEYIVTPVGWSKTPNFGCPTYHIIIKFSSYTLPKEVPKNI